MNKIQHLITEKAADAVYKFYSESAPYDLAACIADDDGKHSTDELKEILRNDLQNIGGVESYLYDMNQHLDMMLTGKEETDYMTLAVDARTRLVQLHGILKKAS